MNHMTLARQIRQNVIRGDTYVDIAYRLARAHSWIAEVDSLNKLAPHVQKLVEENLIKFANALMLAKLSHEKQLKYVNEAVSMDTFYFESFLETKGETNFQS
jgi:hypothetical protein